MISEELIIIGNQWVIISYPLPLILVSPIGGYPFGFRTVVRLVVIPSDHQVVAGRRPSACRIPAAAEGEGKRTDATSCHIELVDYWQLDIIN